MLGSMVMAGMGAPSPCPQCGQIDLVQRVPGIVASQSTALSWELRAPPPPGATVRGPRRGTPGWVWVLLAILLVTLPLDLLLLAVVAFLAVAFFVVIGVAVLVAAA